MFDVSNRRFLECMLLWIDVEVEGEREEEGEELYFN